ncbi:hypothetical protein Q8A67_006034 [Cirrhinus molitorella]|uniref:Sushi domain-containing protein n=1 Tax=Cirrhinus molitorella TaxID=172907 RepID=A0AA88QBT9_9TELE|nr:hypothetical protein Q8A67_006034 [Cirrhinus molitorella]
MKSSLAFLCLWICVIVDVSKSDGCSEIPEVENAEVAESTTKDTYSDGDKLEYTCLPGYASQIKIIYKCSKNNWTRWRGEKCLPKRCESPEDIPNGRYAIESGSSFVFGTMIKYICNEGYQMVSRFDTRTCRDGGWDNQLPACEEVSCERNTTEENISVEGLPEFSEDLIRYGHRLTFSCVGQGLMIKGQKEITCQSNGEWSSPFPKCVEATCSHQWNTTLEDLNIEGLPETGGPIKPGHKITFSCIGEGLKINGQREITCQSDGQWSSPFPKCEVTCEGEQLINVDILIGHPSINSSYKPGHILVFQCTDVKLKMFGQRTIECLSNGKWDYPYPKCGEPRCEFPLNQHVYRPCDYFSGDKKLGAKQHYYCMSGYDKMAEEATCTQDGWTPKPLCAKITCELKSTTFGIKKINPEGKTIFRAGESVEITCSVKHWLILTKETRKSFTCQESGKWDSEPVCEETKCEVPHDQHVYRSYDYFSGDLKLGAKKYYNCEYGYDKIAEEATCTQDGWTPKPLCAVSRKCGPPPHVNNADTKDMTKKEYNLGERVEYMCFNKYTLNEHPPFSKYLTCVQGQWSGNIKCLKPCSVTVEIMNERGIELRWVGQQKMFIQHYDHITFMCQRGKVSVAQCHKPRENFMKLVNEKDVYENEEILNYKCIEPYNEIPEGRFICENGKWRGNFDCTSKTCPPPPYVENGDYITVDRDGEVITKVQYTCKTYYVLNKQKQYYKCVNGIWETPPTCLKPCEMTPEIAEEHNLEPIREKLYVSHEFVNTSFGKQLKMKYCKIFLFLLLMIIDVSTNAQEVTCEAEQLINVDILFGHPSISSPYKPGNILVFRCTDVKLKMHGQRTIECLSTGKWNHPYPKCGDVTCNLNTRETNIKIEQFPDFECPVKPGYNLTFSCNGQGLILKGQREITCQSNGEWSSPFPSCEDKRTEVSRKCGKPPLVNNADTKEITRNEYNTEERVEYKCFDKYILDEHPPFSKYLTCKQGQWNGNIKCLKPCTVTVEIMDKRGIELQWVEKRNVFAEHNDYITFKCQEHKVSVDIALRQKCNDGDMTLPMCV